MVSQIFQVHVFRPAEAAASASRLAEQASFSRVLGQTTAEQGGRAARSAVGSRAADVGAATEPWLRTEDKRALAGSIERASAALGVEPALAVAVAIAESSLNPSAQAADGLSAGTFQVRPSTASDMKRLIERGGAPRAPGNEDVTLGVTYLRHLDELFSQDTKLGPGLSTRAVADPRQRRLFAIAAFNAGQGRVAGAQAETARLGGDPTRYEDVRPHLPSTTRTYVDRVSRYAGSSRTTLGSA